MTDFAGLSAVVTGGASGIGLAIATRLADGGARAACLDLSPDGLPVNLIGIQADIADSGAVTAAIGEAEHRLEGLDILVNNAVNPGTADTPWAARLLSAADDPAAERAALEARQPHGRLASPDGGISALRLRPRS